MQIWVVTSTRAEYGCVRWVLEGIRETLGLMLQVTVTGMCLSLEFSLTINTSDLAAEVSRGGKRD